jgi:hypothetical protein
MVADDKLLGLRLSTAVVYRNIAVSEVPNRSLCVGILEIASIPVMWRFSDLGALELYVL